MLPYSKYELAGKIHDGYSFRQIPDFKSANHLFAEDIRDLPLIWIDDHLDYFLTPGIRHVRKVMKNDLLLLSPGRTSECFFGPQCNHSSTMEGLIPQDLRVVDQYLFAEERDKRNNTRVVVRIVNNDPIDVVM